jgi:YHS domain-containing protein
MKLKIAIGIIVVLVGIVISMISIKKISPISWGWYGKVYAPQGEVLAGFDPVAYHTEAKAVKGSAEFSSDWKGQRMLFSSAANKAAFDKSPDRYAPAFDGFCSFAASKGFTAKSDPEVWRVENGRLHVFNDAGMRDKWMSELSQGVVARGKQNWTKRPQ